MITKFYPGIPEGSRTPTPDLVTERYKQLVTDKRFLDAKAVSMEWYQGVRYYGEEK